MTSRAGRRDTDRELPAGPAPAAVTTTLPVPVASPPKPESAASPFDAQLYGQPGQKRGLRGGQPVLDHARSAYLGAEYSGAADRRPSSGIITKKEI